MLMLLIRYPYYDIKSTIAFIRIYHNRYKNLHHGQKIRNKSTEQEGKKDGDDMDPKVDLCMEIKRTNHRKVDKVTQKTNELSHITINTKAKDSNMFHMSLPPKEHIPT